MENLNNDITTRAFWDEKPLPMSIEELEKLDLNQRRSVLGFKALPSKTIFFGSKRGKSYIDKNNR